MPATDHRIPVPAKPAVKSSTRTGNKSRLQENWEVEPVESMPATDLQRLSQMRQQAVRTSDWALLSTLDSQQAIEEGVQRKEHRKQAQLETRRALESQMQEVNQRIVGELKKKDADKRMVEQATHKFLADEQERLATLHAKHRMMKDDAVKQIKIYRHKQAQKLRIKMEDETIELQDIQHDVRLEQEKVSQRKDAMRVEQQQLQLENQARIAAKEVARRQTIADDRRLMEETLYRLEAKEKQRLADVHAFHEMIAKRGENAGKQVVKEAHDRAVREERLIRETESKKAIEEEHKLAAMVAKKAKMELEVDESRQHQLRLREQLKEATAEEDRRFVVEVEAKAKHAAYVHKVNMQARRMAALQHQELIQTQIADKLQRDFLDDTEMSMREKQFMNPELAKARNKVDQPRHINIF